MDSRLPGMTHALLTTLDELSGDAATEPGEWRQLGVSVASHAAWLEGYLGRSWRHGSSEPRMETLRLLSPVLDRLRPVKRYLPEEARTLIAEAERGQLFDPGVPTSTP
jgi:hypothetical protein